MPHITSFKYANYRNPNRIPYIQFKLYRGNKVYSLDNGNSERRRAHYNRKANTAFNLS